VGWFLVGWTIYKVPSKDLFVGAGVYVGGMMY